LAREAQYGNGALGRRGGYGSKYMGGEEIEQILRIQWKSLHSGSPYHEDYYYQVGVDPGGSALVGHATLPRGGLLPGVGEGAQGAVPLLRASHAPAHTCCSGPGALAAAEHISALRAVEVLAMMCVGMYRS
jgi:hypothetical protein